MTDQDLLDLHERITQLMLQTHQRLEALTERLNQIEARLAALTSRQSVTADLAITLERDLRRAETDIGQLRP